MNTRVGKIARLPQAIREQLNQRLMDSERGKDLVAWLNGLLEVQQVMAEQFHGKPISESNLSEWKRGGYPDWLRHQDIRERARWVVEQGQNLSLDEGDNDLSENLAFLIAAELMVRTQALHEISNPKERWRQFRQIALELSRIRRDDQRYRRNELRREQWESTLEPLEEAPADEINNPHPPENPPSANPPQGGI